MTHVPATWGTEKDAKDHLYNIPDKNSSDREESNSEELPYKQIAIKELTYILQKKSKSWETKYAEELPN